MLPFENLSGDASLDWMADAVMPVVGWQLATAPDLFVLAAPTLAAARDQGATRVLRGTLEKGKGGVTRLDTWLEDLTTLRELKHEQYPVRPDQTLLTALTSVAASLGTKPRPYATANIDALRALTQARGQADPAAARERFQYALQADGGFSAAHLALAEYEAASGDRAAALRAVAAFRQSAPRAQAREMAEAEILEARLQGDAGASARALKNLAAASPANASLQRVAAATFERLYWPREAGEAWQRLLHLEPDQPDALRGLAYAKSFGGDYQGAKELLARYRTVAPQDLNTLDSPGEIEFQAGHFEEAAKIFEQMSRTVSTAPQAGQFMAAGWTKAAYSRLMLGDEKGASALFEKGLEVRKISGPPASVLRASWLFQTGRRQQAIELLAAPADATPQVKAMFATEACWQQAASGEWAKALAAVQGAITSPSALFCAFLAQPDGPEAEWRQRAERQFAGPQLAGLRQKMLGYALALHGHYAEAVGPLRAAMYEAESGDEIRLLLARCYLELKQWPQLRETTQPWPVPPTLQPLWSSLFFPSQLALRAQTEQHYERAAEARRWAELHQRYTR